MTDFYELDISTSEYQEKSLNILCAVIILIICLNIFLVLACALYYSFVTCLKFAPKWSFSYFQPIFVAIFVTRTTIKVESIPYFYTLAIVLINNKKTLAKRLLLWLFE